MKSEVIEGSSILSLFRQHPVLILTFSALLCSAVGYWVEYSLLKKFGLNIVVFAEVDDFFLAGLKYPILYLFGFPVFAILITYLFSLLSANTHQKEFLNNLKAYYDKKEEEAKGERNPIKGDLWKAHKDEFLRKSINLNAVITANRYKYFGLTITVMTFLLIYGVYWKVNERFDKIVASPESMAIIQLRTGQKIPKEDGPPAVFITATEKFMFFYQQSENEHLNTFAIPITSLSDVLYTEFVPLDEANSDSEEQPEKKSAK